MWEPPQLWKGHSLTRAGSATAALLATRARDGEGAGTAPTPCCPEKLLQQPCCWLPRSPTSTAAMLFLLLFKSLVFFFFSNYSTMLCIFRQLSSSLLSEWAVLVRICLKSWTKWFELSLARRPPHLGLLTTLAVVFGLIPLYWVLRVGSAPGCYSGNDTWTKPRSKHTFVQTRLQNLSCFYFCLQSENLQSLSLFSLWRTNQWRWWCGSVCWTMSRWPGLISVTGGQLEVEKLHTIFIIFLVSASM